MEEKFIKFMLEDDDAYEEYKSYTINKASSLTR